MNLCNDWLSLIFNDLEQSQRERFVDPSTGEVPAWVTKIDAEKMLFPVRLSEDEKLTLKKVGAFPGQGYAYYGWILDCMGKPSSALSTRFAKGVEEFLEEDFSAGA